MIDVFAQPRISGDKASNHLQLHRVKYIFFPVVSGHVTALVSNASGFSASKYVPFGELLWFSIVANTSIIGMNFSLMLNSAGFYQISKLSMIQVVIRVGVSTVTDVQVNAKGFICAVVAALSISCNRLLNT